jgi:hypothetical protein
MPSNDDVQLQQVAQKEKQYKQKNRIESTVEMDLAFDAFSS